MSSSSGDEDDEFRKRIQEAASEELIAVMNNPEPVSQTIQKKKPSLRQSSNDACNNTNGFELNTSAEFKKHVASKLEAYLDSQIDSSGTYEIQHRSRKPDSTGGVRLLSTSKTILKQTEGEPILPKRGKISRVSSSSDDDEEMKKLASICVSGDTVLGGGEGAFERKCTHMREPDNRTGLDSLKLDADSGESVKGAISKKKAKKRKRKGGDVTS